MPTPKLSILIPTIVARQGLFRLLKAKLDAQAMAMGDGVVEVLSLADNCQRSIGEKRNELLSAANGTFSCFIDDDDDVVHDYINVIVRMIEKNPDVDCLGIIGEMRIRDRFHKWFKHSIEFQTYGETRTHYTRPPNHLNPIRTSIAKRFSFPDKSHGEDTDWAMKLCKAGALKKEYLISRPVYIYKYIPKKKY